MFSLSKRERERALERKNFRERKRERERERGAAVELLGWLGYGAESRHKVVSSRLGFAMRRLETLSLIPAVNEYLFRIREE